MSRKNRDIRITTPARSPPRAPADSPTPQTQTGPRVAPGPRTSSISREPDRAYLRRRVASNPAATPSPATPGAGIVAVISATLYAIVEYVVL